eukprot:1538585-Prymnesium_polylepis.1
MAEARTRLDDLKEELESTEKETELAKLKKQLAEQRKENAEQATQLELLRSGAIQEAAPAEATSAPESHETPGSAHGS